MQCKKSVTSADNRAKSVTAMEKSMTTLQKSVKTVQKSEIILSIFAAKISDLE